MMRPTLVEADETLNHQIARTFASTMHTDSRWTEKTCSAIHDLRSGYQLALGLGKYTNRNVMDGFAGIALNNDQWALRASRELADQPGRTVIGPIRYEVLEPFKVIRFVLEPTDIADFAFDVTMRAWVPAALEDAWPSYLQGGALSGEVQRYHQSGRAEGWFEHRGRRFALDPENSSACRDHSWGVRTGIGAPADDLMPEAPAVARYRIWAPMMLARDDGDRYGLFVSMLREVYADGTVTNLFDCAEELPCGARNKFMMVRPELEFETETRRLRGGVLNVVDQNGNPRPITVTPSRETGFHIGMGGYYGGMDAAHRFGQWHGPSWSDVVSAQATNTAETVARVHQTRDVLCDVSDPVGGGTGYGTIETILNGPFPDLGLS